MDEQKKLMRDLLFLSTNMAAMTSRENLLFRFFIFVDILYFRKSRFFSWLLRRSLHDWPILGHDSRARVLFKIVERLSRTVDTMPDEFEVTYIHMLCTGREVCIEKNCARGLYLCGIGPYSRDWRHSFSLYGPTKAGVWPVYLFIPKKMGWLGTIA